MNMTEQSRRQIECLDTEASWSLLRVSKNVSEGSSERDSCSGFVASSQYFTFL